MSKVIKETQIQFKKGAEANLPKLSVAEPAITTDTGKFYLGTNDGNKEIAYQEQIVILNNKILELQENGVGILVSPNGNEFILKVNDDGTLYAEKNTIPESELPSDFPKYKITGKSSYNEDFLVTPHTDNANVGWIFIMNNKGEIKWYKKIPSFAYGFKKCLNKSGKYRYTYYQTINKEVPKYQTNGGYDNTELVVLDEKFNEIDRTRLKAFGTVEDNFPCENHDYLFIDDGHYILLSYHNNIVTNIPNVDGEMKVVNCIIQEIKNNAVAWHFESINNVELYNTSHTNNGFASFPSSQNVYNDYAHLNSIQLDKRDGNLLTSWRHIGLIKIERFTGKILWMMGRKRNDITGLTNEQCGYLQHDARYEDDYSITIFDNSGCAVDNVRICRYWIDEYNKTLTKFEESKTIRARSPFMGSAKLLDKSKNIYNIAYGGNWSDIAFHEYDFDNNTELMKMVFNDGHDLYRIFRGVEDNSWDNAVNGSSVPIESISVESTISITEGEMKTINVVYTPSTTTEKGVTWSSSNDNIARVNSNGVVTAVLAGSATITATSTTNSNIKASCSVTIVKNNLDIAKNGLLMWVDGRDGSNEENTTIWNDRSGTGHNIELKNTNELSESNGWNGTSLITNGIDGSSIWGKDVLGFSSEFFKGSYTVEIDFEWMEKHSYASVLASQGKSTNSNNADCLFRISYDRLELRSSMGGSSAYSSASKAPLTPKGRYKLRFIKDGENIKYYVNGQLLSEQSGLWNQITDSENTHYFYFNHEGSVPSANDVYKAKAKWHFIRIYNRALTTSEIKQNTDYDNLVIRK